MTPNARHVRERQSEHNSGAQERSSSSSVVFFFSALPIAAPPCSPSLLPENTQAHARRATRNLQIQPLHKTKQHTQRDNTHVPHVHTPSTTRSYSLRTIQTRSDSLQHIRERAPSHSHTSACNARANTHTTWDTWEAKATKEYDA